LKDEADSLSIPQQLIDKLTEQIEHNLSKQTKKTRQRQIIKKHQRGHKEKGKDLITRPISRHDFELSQLISESRNYFFV
jgi:hypothetical protein